MGVGATRREIFNARRARDCAVSEGSLAKMGLGYFFLDGPSSFSTGIKLFQFLVDQANRGESLGVGYAQFVCLIHGAECFEEVARRPYGRADTAKVLRLAQQVTAAAGHRKLVTKNGVTLAAGMDTFIWQAKPPHVRPSSAFRGTPYTQREWKRVFPDGTRRLLDGASGFAPCSD
jgi:hypothetical protein